MRLLIVEDHPWVLRTLSAALRRRGLSIRSAASVNEARERLLHDAPCDAVICEEHLADGTGLELLGWMRWKQHIAIPFLLIARSTDFEAAYDDAFGVMVPPVGANELLARLHTLVREAAGGVIARQIPFAAEPQIQHEAQTFHC